MMKTHPFIFWSISCASPFIPFALSLLQFHYLLFYVWIQMITLEHGLHFPCIPHYTSQGSLIMSLCSSKPSVTPAADRMWPKLLRLTSMTFPGLALIRLSSLYYFKCLIAFTALLFQLCSLWFYILF